MKRLVRSATESVIDFDNLLTLVLVDEVNEPDEAVESSTDRYPGTSNQYNMLCKQILGFMDKELHDIVVIHDDPAKPVGHRNSDSFYIPFHIIDANDTIVSTNQIQIQVRVGDHDYTPLEPNERIVEVEVGRTNKNKPYKVDFRSIIRKGIDAMKS